MGLEATCTARVGRRSSEGKARLETSALEFRGSFRLDIPFAHMRKVEAARGVLRIEADGDVVTLALGAAAPTWADKIRHPKPVIDKLGVKPGHVVSVLGVDDAPFLAAARDRAAQLSAGRARRGSDLVFLGAASKAALRRLAALRAAIVPDGAVWVVWPKGRPELREDDVRAAALAAGLVDVKVVAFSPTHSALKLVIRRADRPRG
jgi:hypothetical protein